MSDILYERPLGSGPVVRVRRTTVAGEAPVHAVLEVDRRGGELREGQTAGNPPPLLQADGASDTEVLTALLHYAMEDAEVAKLMRDQGLR